MNKRYAKFYDLTYLFDYVMDGEHYTYSQIGTIIPRDYDEEYREKVSEYIKNPAFKDGDIIFIGHTYETRQELGFYSIKDNKLVRGLFDFSDFLEIPGVYYMKAIEAINNFWVGLTGGDPLVEEYYIEEMKEKGRYSMEKDLSAKKIQRGFRRSRGYAEWAYHPERLASQGVFNDLSFGKKKAELLLNQIEKMIEYLQKL